MKFIIALSPTTNATPEAYEATRVPSAKMLWNLYLAGVIREMYSRADGKGVLFIAEANDAQALRAEIESWPLVSSGQVAGEVIGLGPFAEMAYAFENS